MRVNLSTLPFFDFSRREFLKGAAATAGAFVLGAYIPFSRREAFAQDQGPAKGPYDPNLFLKIETDNSVTLISKHFEMGQGVTTGLATLVAEELDADWRQMRFAFAPADTLRYRNLRYVIAQATGGSTSTSEAWLQMRQVGAAARAMFVKAAAHEWQVPASEIAIKEGVVSHGAKKENLGRFADAAMQLPAPLLVKLKDPKDWRLIRTTERLPRLDSECKTNGKATFAFDVRHSDMLTVMVRRPDVFGAQVASFA